MTATPKKEVDLIYKGFPLMRKENILYYGSMADSHIIMLQILENKKDESGLNMASRVSVQLQQTSPSLRARQRIVKSTEKANLWKAMDIASIWLSRAIAGK